MNTQKVVTVEEMQRFHMLRITSCAEDRSHFPTLAFKAEFEIKPYEGELPDFDLLVISLYLWHERTRLEHYDQATGVGCFYADFVEGIPQVGEVIQAPVLEVDPQDDEPYSGHFQPKQTTAMAEDDEIVF